MSYLFPYLKRLTHTLFKHSIEQGGNVEHFRVKDLMIPISKYATVKVGTTLLSALNVLEGTKITQDSGKDYHRAILVMDHDGNVIGKIGQLATLQVVDHQFDTIKEIADLERYHFSPSYITWLRDHYRSQGEAINMAGLAITADTPVEKCMQALSPGEFVSEDDPIDIAIHKLIAGTHLGLLVSGGDQIVGILRVSDVFSAVCKEMKVAKQIAGDNSP